MNKYTIISIKKTDLQEDTYSVQLQNKQDKSDEIYLVLSPHENCMAKGFTVTNEGKSILPPLVVVLSQNPSKDLKLWSVGDEVEVKL